MNPGASPYAALLFFNILLIIEHLPPGNNTMARASLYVIFIHTRGAAAATGPLQALLRQQSVAPLLQLLQHTCV
jgi:hypothetical protein